MATPLDPDKAYAMWAATYPPRPHNRLMELEQVAMLQLLPDVIGLTALDAGCGSGRYLKLLHDRGARAVGVDRSAEMVRRARGIGRALRGDLYALPIRSASMSAVVSGLALGDVADLARAVSECARVLKPGGTFVYSVVHPRGQSEGWLRTFDTPQGRFAVEGYWHSPVDHEHACERAGLTIEDWAEPRIDGNPVALVVRARKPEARSLKSEA